MPKSIYKNCPTEQVRIPVPFVDQTKLLIGLIDGGFTLECKGEKDGRYINVTCYPDGTMDIIEISEGDEEDADSDSWEN